MIFSLLALCSIGANAASSWDLQVAPKGRSSSKNAMGTGKGNDWTYDHMFSEPKKGLVMSIINKKYEWTRPYDNGGSMAFRHGSKKEGGELWTVVPQINQDEFMIYNAATNRVVECGSDYNLRLKGSDDLNNKMKFKFVDAGDGWYYIESLERPGAYIAADSDARGLCWKPEEVHLCKEDGWYSGHCWYDDCYKCQHGARYSGAKDWCCHAGDLYNYDDCYRYCDQDRRIPVVDSDGNPDDRFKWRFEDLYASSTAWDLIFQYSNARGCNAKKVLTITKGYTSTFTSSTASTFGIEYGLTASASESIGVAKFDEEMEMKLNAEVSTAVSESSTSYVETTEETEFLIAAHSCMKYMQILITQNDGFTGKDLVFGSHTYQKEVYCNEDNPEFIGVPDETTCPPDSVIDITTEKAVAQADSEESVFVAEPQDFATEAPLAVYGFAAIGFAVLVYGAGRHFTKLDATSDEVKPLEP